jgi:DNA processing protein
LSEERTYWLVWSKLPGIGAVLLKRIHQHFGNLKEAWKASPSALNEVEGLGGKMVQKLVEGRSQLDPEEYLAKHCQQNPHFWTPADPEYPILLLEIPSPPPVLYYRGKLKLEENQGIIPMVAMVGTRYPTEHGRRWTSKISQTLAKGGFTVVSGMADGIDGEAHQSCLNAGGRTIAVLGTGVDQVYPYKHLQLYQQIQENGLILSEYPVGTRPDRGNFPARNRIIAGLSRAILVMEAPLKSGSLITARYANEFGRDVYTLPNSPDIPQSQGCLELLKQGASMIINEAELLEDLGVIPQLDTTEQLSLFKQNSPQNQEPELEPELAKIFQLIGFDSCSFDLIVQESGLNSAMVSGILLQLELLGLITQLPGMRYQRVRNS